AVLLRGRTKLTVLYRSDLHQVYELLHPRTHPSAVTRYQFSPASIIRRTRSPEKVRKSLLTSRSGRIRLFGGGSSHAGCERAGTNRRTDPVGSRLAHATHHHQWLRSDAEVQ